MHGAARSPANNTPEIARTQPSPWSLLWWLRLWLHGCTSFFSSLRLWRLRLYRGSCFLSAALLGGGRRRGLHSCRGQPTLLDDRGLW